MVNKDNLVAAIRTAVAGMVGAVITWLATKGIDIDDAFKELVIFIVFGVVTTGYNFLVNWLQAKFGKAFGFLLLIPKLPTYEKKDGE